MLTGNFKPHLKPLFITNAELLRNKLRHHRRKRPQLLGVLELTRDEQTAKKIFEATGDKTFKGFLPLTWNTAQIVKMRDAKQRIQASGKPLTAFNMAMMLPSISQAAHLYFITNEEKIKGIVPENIDEVKKAANPLLIVAGLAAAAFIIAQLAPYIPKPKGTK